MSPAQLVSLFILTIFVKCDILKEAFENQSQLKARTKEIYDRIDSEGYTLDEFIKKGDFGFVFRAHKTGDETEKYAIKITWDDESNGTGIRFPSCTKYDTQIELAKDNPDIFAPIKNIKMPVRDLIDNTLLPRSGICMTIMPLAEQDLSTALNFLFDAAEDNAVREAKLVNFIKTIVDMNLKFNYSGYLHGDMHEGNILLVKENGKLVPKLNDFDFLNDIKQDIETQLYDGFEWYILAEKWNLSSTIPEIFKANKDLVKVSQAAEDELHEFVYTKYKKFAEDALKDVKPSFFEKLQSKDYIFDRVII